MLLRVQQYYLITFKVIYLYVVLIHFALVDIPLYILTIITTPFGYEDYETLYISFVELYIDTI